MSLDIFIGENRKDPNITHLISIDEVFYWELYPVFKDVSNKTGELIDLYDDANFNLKSQVTLKHHLEQKLNQIYQQEATWNVITGWRAINNKKVKIERVIEKRNIVNLIKTFISSIEDAMKQKKNIIFLGD